MKLTEKISKNFMGLAFVAAIGCGGAPVRPERGLTVENYSIDYDDTPENIGVMLYSIDHNGEMPGHRIQLADYMWSPRDLNGNGVLDNHREVRITMRGNTVVEVYERFMARTLASTTPELASEATLRRNPNGTYNQTIRNLNLVPDMNNFQTAIGNYRDGRFSRNLEKTGRLLDSVRMVTPSGSRPMPSQLPGR